MKAELVPIDGGAPIPITRDVTVIGRREYCDVQVDDPSLSKRHCVLVKTDGLLVLRDLATTNGTKVKGQRIRWAALLPEDLIAMGTVKFRVYLGPDDAPSPSEQAARGRTQRAQTNGSVPIGFPAPTPAGGNRAVPAPKSAGPARPAKAPAPAPAPAKRPRSDFDLPINLEDSSWLQDSSGGEAIIDLE